MHCVVCRSESLFLVQFALQAAGVTIAAAGDLLQIHRITLNNSSSSFHISAKAVTIFRILKGCAGRIISSLFYSFRKIKSLPNRQICTASPDQIFVGKKIASSYVNQSVCNAAQGL
jgi:hypothetical protein